jgi:hypothetical protein
MKMSYKKESRHGAVDAEYSSCATCAHVKDRTGTLTCTHPNASKLKVYCTANNGAEEHTRDMCDSTNYQVDSKEWCAGYKAADAPDAPEYKDMYEAMESAYEQHSPTPHAEYGTGGTASGSGAGGS